MLTGMDTSTKVRENRIRRTVERRGYRLVKNRRRDPMAIGYGMYRVETVAGAEAPGFESTPTGIGMTLDEVEHRLTPASL